MRRAESRSDPGALSVVGYARVSVASGNGDSLEAQAEAIREWAEREGHELLDVYEDEGKSGKLDASKRPGLAAALTALEDGATALVVHRIDRLARELHVQEAALGKAWASGARVYSVVDGEILQDDPSDPMRKAMRQMMGVFAELERGMIRARMQGGRRRKRAQGRYIGGTRTYGYRLIADEDGHQLEPDEAEQQVIRRMVELRDSGSTFQQIADVLNEEAVPPPRGREWYPMTLRTVIARAKEAHS